VTGKRPLPGRSGYAASKLAPVGLARTLAVEVGPLGGPVNVVSPGPVEGDRIERVLANRAAHLGITIQEARERLLSDNSLGWFVTAANVPTAVALPASDEAASTTGENLNVSAGAVMY
jgi:meso-butanediol dehydrogenase / (S,S)-butanediol dehydrogenase / diacetyl reductase